MPVEDKAVRRRMREIVGLVSRAARDVRELQRDYEVRNVTLGIVAAGTIVHGLVTAEEAGPDVMLALDPTIRGLSAD